MPKKNPVNGFSLFMKDKQDELRRTGGKCPSMAEMPGIASPLWAKMSISEKKSYDDKAKMMKKMKVGTVDGRLASDGIPLAHLMAEQEEQERKLKQMKSDVRQLVDEKFASNEILEYKFYIISFNILVATDDGIYLPNEVGIVEYTIREGISKFYHTFIDPGPIPMGYTASAKVHSETTHEIPITSEKGSKDYRDIYINLLDFIDGRLDEVIVFCHEDQIVQTQGCLDWMKGASRYGGKDNFYLANISFLLYELRLAVGDPFPSRTLADDAMRQNSFDFSSNTRCEFHEDLDNRHCALGFSRRLGFVLSDSLIAPFGVELKPGHMPQRQETFVTQTWTPTAPIRPAINRINVIEKPIIPHTFTTIVPQAKSKFYDYNEKTYIPSGMNFQASNRSNDSSSSDLETSDFPELDKQMSALAMQGASAVSSFANITKPTVPEVPKVRSVPRQPNSVFTIGQGVGIGRGRALQQ